MNAEFLKDFYQYFIIYLPIGIIGAWRWGVWLVQKVVGWRYQSTPVNPAASRMTLSIVTPVYNEDPVLFRAALDSWQRNNPNEIIAVIDESDEACIDIFQIFQKAFPNATLIITDIPGKRPALALGSRQATGDIIALADSDTVWDPGIHDTLLAPFKDPSVGGVTCRQAVRQPKTMAERLFDIRFSLRYLHEFPYLASVGDAFTCLSGRTAVYRKTALLPVLDGMLGETFLWKPCISGEDKRLTSLVMQNGWKLRYQRDATVRTAGLPALRQFFRQNLRWSRNSWRTDLRMIFSSWAWRRAPLFAYHLVDRSIQPFTLLLGPIYLSISIYFQHWFAASLLFSWIFLSRTIKLLPHLREHPRDFFMVPLFTFAQYHLAVLKLYALLSLDFQSWITRWDSNRLKRTSLGLLPSQAATLSVIIGITYFVFNNASAVAQSVTAKANEPAVYYTDDFSILKIDEEEADFWQERKDNAFVSYATRVRETPASVLRKFNIPTERLGELFPNRSPSLYLSENTAVRIPIEDMFHSLSPALTQAATLPPTITYRPDENMVHIKGSGSVVTLASIARSLPAGQDHLVETAPKEWILRSKLYVSEGVTLILDGNEVSLLKIASSPKSFAYIRSQHGSILVNRTHITSWDEGEGAPDVDVSDGRAFIVAYASGRMDILDSEIAYLGFPLEVAKEYQDFGGVYGLSWKIQNGTFGRYAMTGNAIGNKIHHNYFGLYTYGTSGMLIQNNEVYENIQYGIDPHDDSSYLVIENNTVHHNGNHGIIGSKRVKYSTIRYNRTTDNRLHGIMLDRQSDYNLVERNITSGNINGIALAASHSNLIRDNSITGNRFGIRANLGSSKNLLFKNTIRENERGIFLYEGARKNIAQSNTILGNDQGVYLKNAKLNAIIDSLKSDDNTLALKLDDESRYTNFIERIP